MEQSDSNNQSILKVVGAMAIGALLEVLLMSEEDIEEINKDIEVIAGRIADLIENEYALAVFDKFSKIKPDLIRIKTGEVVSWEDGFGSDFDKISKSLRHSLVGLVEEPGRYKLK